MGTAVGRRYLLNGQQRPSATSTWNNPEQKVVGKERDLGRPEGPVPLGSGSQWLASVVFMKSHAGPTMPLFKELKQGETSRTEFFPEPMYLPHSYLGGTPLLV